MRPGDAPSPIDLAHEAPFRLGRLEVRAAVREIVAGETHQILEPRVMQVLVLLARRRGEVVSREDLIAACWGGRAVGDDAVDRCIAALRKLAQALGGFSIETIARVGYRLSERPGSVLFGSRLVGLLRRRRALVAIMAMVLLVLAGVGTWFAARRFERSRDFSDLRVAVLPFDVLSPGRETADFATGLRNEIVSVLSHNQVLVISHQESLGLKQPGREAAVGRLGVRLLLDGTVERIGDTLRVRVHLDDAKDKITLWSRTFEGPAGDPAVVQTRAAGRATDVVVWLLSDRYGLGAPIDRATLAAYLEAGDEIQNEGGDRYLTIYRQVVERAPRFSYGHSGLGFALVRSAMSSATADRARLLEEARREGETALRLDPHNGEGYLLLTISAPPLAWSERERSVVRGLAVDPALWSMPAAYATLLADVGRSQEALALQERAVAIAPYWPRGRALLARRLLDAGRAEDGLAEIGRTARLWPDDPDVIRIDAQLATETGLAAPGSPPAAGVPIEPRIAVAARAVRGDIDGAFAEAGRLAGEPGQGDTYGYQEITGVLFAPATAPLRHDPRFPALAARLGLVDYWRRSGHWPDFCREPGLPYDCAKFLR